MGHTTNGSMSSVYSHKVRPVRAHDPHDADRRRNGRFCDSRRGSCLGSDWTTDPCASAIAVNLLREAEDSGTTWRDRISGLWGS